MLKKNILFPGVTLMLCSLTAGVMAFSAGTENWDVDGLNGGVTVNATLTDSPCSLAEESAEQKYLWAIFLSGVLQNQGRFLKLCQCI